MGFWESVVKVAQVAGKALPHCHTCGERGAQVCAVCNRVGCHRHSYSNFSTGTSVCSDCMSKHFPFAKDDLHLPVSPDWPYQEMPWEILGVDREASEDEIKKAQREASRAVHPDATGGPDERQVAVNKAAAEMLRMRRRP